MKGKAMIVKIETFKRQAINCSVKLELKRGTGQVKLLP